MGKGFPSRKAITELIVGMLLSLPFVLSLLLRRVLGPPRQAPVEAGARRAPATADEPEAEVEPAAEEPEDAGRRRFLTRLSLAVAGLGTAAAAVPVLGYIFTPAKEEPVVWRAVGAVDDFPIGRTVKVQFLDPNPLPWAGIAAETAAWLRRESALEFVAFSPYCTHVGCPVRWLPDAHLFMCPCHGGAFYQDGSVAAGPPSVPLPRYPVRIRDMQVEIQSRPFILPEESGVDGGISQNLLSLPDDSRTS